MLTGVQPWHTLRNAAPVAGALQALGLRRVQQWVSIGALTGMISSLLVFQLGQARIWFSMSRDGLLPRALSRVHSHFRTPHIATVAAGIAVGIPAGIFDIGTLADLANIGTLFAFVLVSLAVLILRRTQPDRHRAFRVPFSPLLPLLSVFCCLLLMAGLTIENWLRFLAWLCMGLLIYFAYSRKRSALAAGKEIRA